MRPFKSRISIATISVRTHLKRGAMVIAISGLSFSPVSAQLVSETLDITYYEGIDMNAEKHRLDLIMPAEQPIIATMLWIHGGAWAFGDRKDDLEIARAFAREGVAVAVMSYRLSRGDWKGEDFPSTGIQHPEHIKDVARAFAWLHENANNYGLHNGKLLVSGFSAGGHLSALLAMDDRYLSSHNLSPSDVLAAIPVAGGYDLEAYYLAIEDGIGEDIATGHVLGVFGPREGLPDASPISYLETASVPMLVLTEGETAAYTRTLEHAVRDVGRADLIRFSYYNEETHASLLANLSRDESPAREEMLNYITSLVKTEN